MPRSRNIAIFMQRLQQECSAGLATVRVTNPVADAVVQQHALHDPLVTNIRNKISRTVDANCYSEPAIRMAMNTLSWADQDIGRCDECGRAAVAISIRTARQMGVSTAIELVGTPGHQFVIIGRRLNSNLKNVASWGDDAFVIDIWYANQHQLQSAIIEPSEWEWLISQQNEIILDRGWRFSENADRGRLMTWTPNTRAAWSIL